MSGWNLTGRLVGKHFAALGDTFAQAIASFDPETATQADRDALQEKVITVNTKLAAAKRDFDKEHQDVVNLTAQLASDKNVLVALQQRLAAGTVTEATVNTFIDEYTANQNRLPQEQAEEAQAKEFLDQLQQIVDTISDQLRKFDENAKAAQRALEQAKNANVLEDLKTQRAHELESLGGLKDSSTALNALTAKAQKLQDQAAGKAALNSVLSEKTDREAEIAEIRASVNTPAPQSASDRLAALLGN